MRWFWLLLLLLAAILRLPGADWDGGIAAHPDERFLVDVAAATPLWGDPMLAAPDFPYGHLPLYLLRLLMLGAPRADPLYVGRLASGLLGVLLVAATGALGRRLAGERAGLLAAMLLACAPFALQQARFYTVDVPGAVCVSLTLLFALRRNFRAAGAFWGLVVACKASLVWIGLPLGLAFITLECNHHRRREILPLPITSHATRLTLHVSRITYYALRLTSTLLLPAVLSVAVASPWALLRPAAAWRGPWIQSLMVAGRLDFPYTRQYAGTWPFFYPLAQMAWWGLGPTATLAGLASLGVAAARWRRLSPLEQILWAATVCCFLALAGWYVKFPRYLFPVYPLWCAWTACLLEQKNEKADRRGRQDARCRGRAFARWWGAAGAVMLPTALLGAAQLSIYARPHPWESASRWLYAHLPAGATVAVEHWDHPLPIPLPGGDAGRYTTLILPVMDDETPEKLLQLEGALRESDVLVLASARGYGAVARQPARYAATLHWYAELLEAREVLAFGRCPQLGPLALSDDPLAEAGLPMPLSLAQRCGAPYALRLPRLDESFRVYDAPTVLLAVRAP